MHDGLRILTGAGVTALIALVAHGPMGMGASFMAQLQEHARAVLATRGLGDVKVSFPDSPYARVAHLSGDVPQERQADAVRLLRTLRGGAGAMWDGGRGALADAGGSVPPPANAVNAAEPAPAQPSPPAPAAKPSPSPSPTPTPAPSPSATPAPKPAPAAAAQPGPCQGGVDKALGGRVMSFRSGSAWLNPQSRRMIADVAAALKPCRGYALVIGGHTDASGSEGVNAAMSQERAERVRAALVEQGVPAGAVTARGYGSTRPLPATNAADPANRRISFTVTGGGA